MADMYAVRRITVTIEVESGKGRMKREGMNIEFLNQEQSNFPIDNMSQMFSKYVGDKIQIMSNEFFKEEQNLIATQQENI